MKMLIDWFTVAAQLLNFLILIWLLRRFLYRPVLKALDERERKVTAELDHAASIEREATRHRSEWENKNAEIERNREQLLRNAEAEAEQQKALIMEASHKAGDEFRNRLEASLQHEREQLAAETARKIEEQVYAIAGKVLDELAGRSLEEQITDRFCQQLMTTGDETVRMMNAPFHEQRGRAVIRSRFRIDDTRRDMIRETVLKRFSTGLQLVFETSEDPGATGIELCMNGQCISWTISAALEEMGNLAGSPDGSSGGQDPGGGHG